MVEEEMTENIVGVSRNALGGIYQDELGLKITRRGNE